MADTNTSRILLVEDEESLRSTLRLNFELEKYHVTTAVTGAEALERARSARFDLIVLDVMLPEVDGFTVCETLRLENNNTPVLFLTARNSSEERLRGLRSGDDHLGKPFDLQELLLRIDNLIRRSGTPSNNGEAQVIRFGGNEIDLSSYEVVGSNGQRKRLTKREAMLLRLLVEKEGQVVSREEILQKIWGYNVYPSTRTIDNYIVAFRKYFERDPKAPKHFISVRGIGYRFIGQ